MSDPTIPTTLPAEADQGTNGLDELGRLRSENASWRRKLRDTEQGQTALVEAARTEERQAMTGKLVDAYIVASATSRFSDVRDALALIDRDGLVNADGEIDGKGLAERLDALLAERPHLAGRRFAGSADQGARTSAPVTSGDWGRDLLRRRE